MQITALLLLSDILSSRESGFFIVIPAKAGISEIIGLNPLKIAQKHYKKGILNDK